MTNTSHECHQFSVIIPTYNRPAMLKNCLETFERINYPRDRFEIIVVDDGGKTDLSKVLSSISDNLNIRLLRANHAGCGNARNTGAAVAQYEYLVFTDDDCQPDADWLKILSELVSKNPDYIFTGRTINTLRRNIYSEASQLLVDYMYNYYNPENKSARFFTGNNLMIPVKTYIKLNGFDRSFIGAAEDREICFRLMDSGYKIFYSPKLVINHSHILTFRTFFRQHFRYGQGAFSLRQKRGSLGKTMKLEPLSFYKNIILYPIENSRYGSPMLLVGLMIVSQIANTAGFFSERFNLRISQLKR